tara:strand:- start:55 stop:156 length:102 start_codon:yes stop_codon:yes gene_type:complete
LWAGIGKKINSMDLDDLYIPTPCLFAVKRGVKE